MNAAGWIAVAKLVYALLGVLRGIQAFRDAEATVAVQQAKTKALSDEDLDKEVDKWTAP